MRLDILAIRGAADAHAATVEADTHPFARQGPVAGHGDTPGRRQRRIPQAGAGLSGRRAEAHQTRPVAREAPTGEQRCRRAGARCLHHVQRG